ncbi:MAG: hypothetical protein ACRC7N_01675 [Clostridium sp.]
MKRIEMYLVALGVIILSLDYITPKSIFPVIFIMGFGIMRLIERNDSYKMLIFPTVIILAIKYVDYIPNLNITNYLMFSLKEIMIIITVFAFVKLNENDAEYICKKYSLVGLNVLIVGEAIKFITNSLMMNFDSWILNYFFVVGYGLPIVAIIYLVLATANELKSNQEFKDVKYSRVVKPGGNRNKSSNS